MLRTRRTVPLALVVATAAFTVACDEDTPTAPTSETLGTTTLSANRAATTDRGTFTVPFPPVPGVDFAPVPAPCLGLGEPLRMSGTWTGWYAAVEIPRGRYHLSEKIDYSEITLRTDELTWVAGPGATETIVQNVPLTGDDVGEAAFNVVHEFHARFVSRDGAPDLHVSHRVRQLLGPDGELRKNEFVPFTAECIGGGR